MYIFHDHLDGGLRPDSLLEMAKELKYTPIMNLTPNNAAILMDKSNSKSLEDFLSAFTHTIALMQSYENLERIAYEAAEDMAMNGIKFYESRFAPLYSVNEDLTINDVILAIKSGFDEAEKKFGIKSGIIVCGMRNDPKSVNKLAQFAINNISEHIIGFDIAGPEIGFPPSMYRNEFQMIKKNAINLTIHAGEGAGVDYIKDAIECGAQRIGHGVRIIEDIEFKDNKAKLGKTASYIRDNQIPLEICISSNIHTKMYKDIKSHPISILFDLGFNISINTDNRLMSSTSYIKEQKILSELGIDKNINNKSASYSFL